MHVFRDEEKYETAYAWPFVYAFGTLLVHPFFLLGMRVQCAHFARTAKLQIAYKNTASAIRHIGSNYGIRGFYKGFGPSCVLYCLIGYRDIKEAVEDTYALTVFHRNKNKGAGSGEK